MAFNFSGDESDSMDGFDMGEVPADPPASDDVSEETIQSKLEPLQEVEEDYEQVLSQVDRRMRVAYFYRSILDSILFSEETSEARIVQSKIRKFCNDELEVIFGMRSAKAAPTVEQFSVEEVEILKNLAAQVRITKEAKGKPPIVVKPTVRQVQTKPQPVVQTIQTQTQALPVAALKPQPKPAVPQAQPKKPTGPDQRIPERYRNDPTAKVVKGKVYIQARNDSGGLVWRDVDAKTGEPLAAPVPVMRDVTPTPVPTGSMIQPMPMPSIVGGQFSQIMEQQASDQLARLDRVASLPGPAGAAARLMGGALTRSIGGGEDES